MADYLIRIGLFCDGDLHAHFRNCIVALTAFLYFNNNNNKRCRD